jgi:glycosyltransferase involved in cell wall biosynthesis
MKILFLNNYNYVRGGAERVFLAEASVMNKYGNTVNIFARRHASNLPSPYDKYFPGEMVTDSLKPTMQGLRSLLQLFYSLDAKKCLTEMLQNIKIDIAHAHNIYGRLTTSVLDVLHDNNIPIVMTLHDYKLICPAYSLLSHGRICEECKGHLFYMAIKKRCHKESFFASTIYAFESYFNKIYKKYENNVRFFISPSQFLMEKFIQFGWPEERLVYVPNFIESSNFEADYTPRKYFVYLGRLSSEKGISTLIEAFMNINFNKVGLAIVGEGPLKDRLTKMAACDSRIRFTGYLSGNTLKEETSKALAVIVPSECYENAPLSILEAFAFGKPVIGSRIGGIPEMIDDGVNGYLFEPGNVDDLREKLDLVLSMPGKRITEMGQAAQKKVEKQYSADLHYEMLMSVYHRALNDT